MITKKSNGNLFIGIYLSFTIVMLIALGPYFSLQQIGTYILIPLLAVIGFFYDSKTFHINNSELKIFFLLFIISLTSVFYYQYYDPLITGLSSLFGAFLAAYIAVSLNKNIDYSFYFHIGYILAMFVLILIMYLDGNFSFANFASEVDYRDRFLLNANAYSYLSFFANFSLFYLHQKYKTKLISLLLLFSPILFLIISFVTQSRSGLLFTILINIIYWFLINKEVNLSVVKKIFKKLIIISVLIFLTFKFVDVYENSRIKNRVTADRVDPRELLVYNSFKVFTDRPITGVGINQLPYFNGIGQFSHNSFIEILAESGILGGIVLLLLFGVPLRKSIISLKRDKNNPILRINLMFFLFFYIFNLFYPFYKFPFSMMYFFLVISIQNKNSFLIKRYIK